MHIRWIYTRFITQLHTICVSSNCKKTQFLLFLCCSSPWHKKAGHSSACSISEIWSHRFVQCYWEVRVPPYFWINQSINQYVFQDFTRILLTGYMVNHSNNPRTDIGKPVFMTDLQMHWYRLCDDILENNDTIFGKTITIFRNRKWKWENRQNRQNKEIDNQMLLL